MQENILRPLNTSKNKPKAGYGTGFNELQNGVEVLMHILPPGTEGRMTENKFIGFYQVVVGIDLIVSKIRAGPGLDDAISNPTIC